eukprot:1017443-Karenia_brevis.AAC.1
MAKICEEHAAISDMSLVQAMEEMATAFKHVKKEAVNCSSFVDIFSPLWRCHPYPLVVLLEALARA